MLKAIQILSSSSSFVAYRWKPHPTNGFILVSSTSLSYSKRPSTPPLLYSPFSASKTTPPRPISTNSIRSHSNMDGSSSATSPPPPSSSSSSSSGNARKISFCQWCGGPMKHEIPDGDEKKRAICSHCGKIAYQNPKMVVGCLIVHDNKVLLCKRNIEPSYGLWTLPAGYLELGESAAEGAIRETLEEACAEVEVVSPFTQLDIPLIGQTYVIFLAKLKKPQFSPGPESLECRLFSLEDIPFDSLAFSSMLVTLNLYAEDIKAGKLKFHYGTINKRPGTSPSDIRAYTLDYHLQS